MSPRHIAAAVLALFTAACQGGIIPTAFSLTAYKIDIQQGNYVTQEMVAKLQPGMTRGQVRFVLGTPLLADIFHNDRWDYVYYLEKDGKRIEERKMVAVFSGDKLVRIEGDVVPAAAPAGKPAAKEPAAKEPAAKEPAKSEAAQPPAQP